MSVLQGCRCEGHWRRRLANYVVTRRLLVTVNGEDTPSKYSEIKCLACRKKWRSRAAYVAALPDYRERKYGKLTDAHILEMLQTGLLAVDVHAGVVRKQRRVGPRWTDEWITLKSQMDRNGYPAVRIRWNGRRKAIMVHRLVWMANEGRLIPAGYDIDHLDRDRGHASYKNLRLRLINHNRGDHEVVTIFGKRVANSGGNGEVPF